MGCGESFRGPYARAEPRRHDAASQVGDIAGENEPGLAESNPGESRGYRRANDFSEFSNVGKGV